MTARSVSSRLVAAREWGVERGAELLLMLTFKDEHNCVRSVDGELR